jgi:hypothetical protein
MAAALPFLTNDAALLSPLEAITPRPLVVPLDSPHKPKELLEITGVFRGRELTRKERRLTCGIAPLDRLIGGGIVRGRISEIIGNPGAGKTSLAAAFAASITARGEVAAWIDAAGDFDPASIAAAGVDLARMLWVAMPPPDRDRPSHIQSNRSPFSFPQDLATYPSNASVNRLNYFDAPTPPGRRHVPRPAGMIVLKTAEWILTAGGFGLVVIDCAAMPDSNGRLYPFTQGAALRLAHGAERSGAAVLVLAPHRMCGTFAALSLMLSCNRACFSRACRGAPILFDGLTVEARVTRNKLGGSGNAVTWSALADPPIAILPEAAPSPHSPPSSVLETAPSAARRIAAR